MTVMYINLLAHYKQATKQALNGASDFNLYKSKAEALRRLPDRADDDGLRRRIWRLEITAEPIN